MAVYVATSGITTDLYRCAVQSPPDNTGLVNYTKGYPHQSADGMPALGGRLDVRFDDAGITEWENPGASGG